ncbi:hypothetical protein DEI99_016935 [Curtobacterium sp. MCLR17_036]|uniref:hypothetical protein n=1 Tax=Curtobacterium sp. MCLR17_036 TaxID=2175620 RepID=UPI000DA903F5|nr:hypothetical protein [Curtobacterium sp. MCLR17_036]WIE64896.1 hypothetical protein DEI99_016935 [Curtobacterium sp. MCLR17_036]
MSTLPGIWDLSMRTPIGTINARMQFTADRGIIVGAATGRGEDVPLRDVRVEDTSTGEHVTWSQSITKPMRLNLEFDVLVNGDGMVGHSRAGRLPRTTVTGTRVLHS